MSDAAAVEEQSQLAHEELVARLAAGGFESATLDELNASARVLLRIRAFLGGLR